MFKYFLPFIFFLCTLNCSSKRPPDSSKIITGAEQLGVYLPLLKGKEIGLFVNHTSMIGQTHLADTLSSLGITVKRIFSPEHGFRGNTPDGELITNENDQEAYSMVSLYGKSKRPTDEQIKDLDAVVVDIQDVGVRFYTYASTMTYIMEACAANDVPVILLDRPNPNGSYVDGPVLEEANKSFIGLHPIPLVHGCTLGELAKMINGEGWLKDSLQCSLQVVPVKGWAHSVPYKLPVPPSPNLPNELSVSLYPSLALFEGTVVSIGRGTDNPFQVIGHPAYPDTSYSFIPKPNSGSKYPPLESKTCFGLNLKNEDIKYQFTISYLIDFYKKLDERNEKPFFNDYFEKLAGTDSLRIKIESGWTEKQIKNSWDKELNDYRRVRSNYLLYK